MIGALIIYGNYLHAINIVDPDKTRTTASLFATYALDYLPGGTDASLFVHSSCSEICIILFSSDLTVAACFFSEFLGTAVLLIGTLAALDKGNGPPPVGLVPLVIFLIFLGEGLALGMQTAFALNPVRYVWFCPKACRSPFSDYRAQFFLLLRLVISGLESPLRCLGTLLMSSGIIAINTGFGRLFWDPYSVDSQEHSFMISSYLQAKSRLSTHRMPPRGRIKRRRLLLGKRN